MKRFLALFLAVMFCFSAAVAEYDLKMSDEPVTLTCLQALNDDLNIDADTNYAIQWLEEQTNVHIDYEFVKNSDWDTKFSLTMVSGELPDIIWAFNRLDDEEYGVTQKIFIPVDDLIDEYMPNLKALLDNDPNALASSYASDGHVYALPAFYENVGIDAMGFQFINQVWLDNLGLEMPTTLDELTDVLRAFKEGDPNGNGIADELPLSCSFDDHVNTGIWFLFFYYGIPTDGQTFFSLDEEGNVTFDAYRDGFRECVEWMNTLYNEGLMDIEALTQDVATYISKVNDGIVGFMPLWRLTGMNIDNSKDQFVLFAPVSADGYTALRHKESSFAYPRIYLHDEEKAEFICRYFDKQLDPEVQFIMNYGEKDIDWHYTEEGKLENLTDQFSAPNKGKMNCAFKFRSPEIIEKTVIASGNVERLGYTKIQNEQGFVQSYSNSLMKCAIISAEDSARLALSLVDIKKAVKEFVSNGIVNGVTDESWDAFMKDCESLNVQDYIDTYNAAMVNVINH